MSISQSARRGRSAADLVQMLQDPAVRLPLTYFVAFQLLDTVTTLFGLVLGLDEVNPLAAGVLHRFGPFGLLIDKAPVILGTVLGATLLPRRAASAVVWALSATTALALASNVGLLFAAR
jgi:hypothetical protein